MALSRPVHGFESRRERHIINGLRRFQRRRPENLPIVSSGLQRCNPRSGPTSAAYSAGTVGRGPLLYHAHIGNRIRDGEPAARHWPNYEDPDPCISLTK
jgi:hypothetical protein